MTTEAQLAHDKEAAFNPLNAEFFISSTGSIMTRQIDEVEVLYAVADIGSRQRPAGNLADLIERSRRMNEWIVERESNPEPVSFGMHRASNTMSITVMVGTNPPVEVENIDGYDLAKDRIGELQEYHRQDRYEWSLAQEPGFEGALSKGSVVYLIREEGRETEYVDTGGDEEGARAMVARINHRRTMMHKYRQQAVIANQAMTEAYPGWANW